MVQIGPDRGTDLARPGRRVEVGVAGDRWNWERLPPATILAMFSERLERVRTAMDQQQVDAVALSVGPDLPWLVGYQAMPLERLTMLVVPADGEAVLFIPAFEVPRVVERPGVFTIRGWTETENPVALVADKIGAASRAAIGDHTWSRFLVALQRETPNTSWTAAGEIIGPLRAVKEPHEIDRLRAAATGVDRVAAALQSGEIKLIGRTEADVSVELGRRILAEGHARVNFAIVAAGENAASPHHHAGGRIIGPNEVVLCDFGGTTDEPDGQPGYCSDITRCVYTGTPPAEFIEIFFIGVLDPEKPRLPIIDFVSDGIFINVNDLFNIV